MLNTTADNGPSWYVVHTNPRQEERAEKNLRAWSVATFFPKLKQRRYSPFTGEQSDVTKPLFTRYIFVRFDLEMLFHKVRYTRGVHSLVSLGGGPVSVDDEVIKMLQSRVDQEGFVKIGEDFKPGELVIVRDGPFRDIHAVFERDMNDRERVIILLDALNYRAHIEIERSHLIRAAAL